MTPTSGSLKPQVFLVLRSFCCFCGSRTWSSVAGWFWLRDFHEVAVKLSSVSRCHPKAWLGRKDPLPRWHPHLAVGLSTVLLIDFHQGQQPERERKSKCWNKSLRLAPTQGEGNEASPPKGGVPPQSKPLSSSYCQAQKSTRITDTRPLGKG